MLLGATIDVSHYWPAVATGSTLVKRHTARMHVLREPSGAIKWATVVRGKLDAANNVGGTVGYEAQIARTTDGGATWSTVFSSSGAFYFNGIECASDQDCCAVAEDEGPPYTNSSDAGTYVFCTTDGGATWVDTFRDIDSASSLLDIAALSPLTYWAVGAELGPVGPLYPTFYLTVDGGKTWTSGTGTDDMLLMYAVAIDCVAGVNCWVNMLDILTQETSIAVLKKTTR
jgi:photosystem II stability/assembly factor-like uncharacterized protein